MSDRPSYEAGWEYRSVACLLAAGYAASAILSIALFRFDGGVAGIWLPNVLAVALILRNPSLRMPLALVAVFVGCLAANLLNDTPAFESALYSVANVATVLLEVTLIRQAFGGRKPAIGDVRDYVLIFAAGAIVAPACTAVVFGAVTAVVLNWSFDDIFWSWMVGETLGFSVLLPILMTADRQAFAGLFRRAKLLRLVVAVGGSVLIALLVSDWTQFPFLLVIAPLMIAAAFAAPFELAIACGIVSAALVGLASSGAILGPASSAVDFNYGFQLSVALLAALPFLAGLIMDRMRRDRRRIAENEQLFRCAMEDSAIGVAIVALDGRILEVNAAFAGLLGYSREELETLTVLDITHSDELASTGTMMERLRAGAENAYHVEKRYRRKDGTPVWTRLSGSVIRNVETGRPMYFVSQVEDIDAQKQSQKAIADAETRWSFALASAGQGMWDLDMKRGYTIYSSTWKQMMGYGEREMNGDPDHWLTLIHPDDRERVVNADRAHLAGETALFEEEFRMQHRDGHWLWILDRGRVVERDEEGVPARAIGTLTDITMRREAEERLLSYAALLADEKERLRVTLDSIGDAVICTDAEMRITFMNPVAENLTGVVESKALGKPLDSVYAPVDEETGEKIASAAALAGLRQRTEHNSRAILSKKDGSRCGIREVVSPIHSEKGEFSGLVIVFQDFTDARALQRRLAYAAVHDPLTGLANRAGLRSAMLDLVSAPRSTDRRDFFLYIDLDNFKAVNDTGGHAAGDQLLKKVAEALRAAVSAGDVVARVGGDEFALVLKDCGPDDGAAAAEKLVAAIGALSFERDGAACRIGASIGLTAINRDETDIDAIVARADLGSYQAKTGGGRRFVSIDAPPGSPESEIPVSLARAS